MKKIARKKTKEQYEFPKNASEFNDQINKQELKPFLWNGEDFSKELGINQGDIILCHPTNEIDENQITVWDVKEKDGYCFGFAYENFDEIGIINPCYEDSDVTYKKRRISLVGVFVGVVKPYDAQKFPNFPYEKETQSEEITAVCDKCKAQLSGTSKFIKSQGWSLRKNETLCLNCDLFGGEK